jgi:hypothetical protein
VQLSTDHYSDVLFRHKKSHNEKTDPQTPPFSDRRSTISEGVVPQLQQRSGYHSQNQDAANTISSGIPLMQILSPTNYLASNESGLQQTYTSHTSLETTTSYIDQHGPRGPLNMRASHSESPVTQMSAPPRPSHADIQSPSQESGDTSNYDTSMSGQRQQPSEQPPDLQSTALGQAALDWLPQGNMVQADFHDPYQLWLFPSLEDLDQSPDFLQTYNTGITPNFATASNSKHLNEADGQESNSTINKVPRERFARVQRCWAPRPHRLHRTMPNLWKDVMVSPHDNLFSQDSDTANHSRSGTNWGLDATCRFRLKESFRMPAPSAAHSPRIPTIDPLISTNGNDNSDFPPAEILDIALGLYFRRFHPMVPVVHVPTFCVKSTPAPLLFAMCLVGLSILGTTGATRFVSRMFSPLLERVSFELASCTSGVASCVQQLTYFATALLTLNLAAMTGDKDSLAQSQMLYVSLVAMAQQNGLLSASDGSDLNTLLSESNEAEDQWKAWCRVESARRLILSLLTLDSWYSNLLNRPPIIRSEAVCVYAPCDEILFQARSATQWRSLVRSGKSQTTPTFQIEDLHTSRLDPAVSLGYLGSNTLLSLLQIQMLETYHRLMPADEQTVGSLVPWQMYTNDYRARSMVTAVLASESFCGPSMQKPDTNCILLWHSLCIMLLSDFRMFELAAGRHGAGPATGALANIRDWSRSIAARRAVVHAAQTFRLMSERKVSDNVTMSSVAGLFVSALVLGLYQFMVAPASNHATRTLAELIETDVEWSTDIADLGFTDDALPGSMNAYSAEQQGGRNADTEDLSPVNYFIRYGGTVSLAGVMQQGGYESARRVLLDFANLMDGISGRKLRMFTQILHIMSDDLMNVDIAL